MCEGTRRTEQAWRRTRTDPKRVLVRRPVATGGGLRVHGDVRRVDDGELRLPRQVAAEDRPGHAADDDLGADLASVSACMVWLAEVPALRPW